MNADVDLIATFGFCAFTDFVEQCAMLKTRCVSFV